ncbi:MAG: UDP-N-acetylmuramoyl-L-alanyl-D-glutamate--2,6-diaminopimelate ligase [Ruminococcus sp.]|nr:UDP-N-acetylmuramoyl-L-alanyl-D-glutamate--2,6-diaminopimelate ligase [Candidatus Copronaster equi]
MLLSDILKKIDYKCESFADCEIKNIVYDSRKAEEGTLFVCLSGLSVDGHSFANGAYDKGCRVFMVEHIVSLPDDCMQIVVDNSRAMLAVASANFFRQPYKELKIIGITGTKGKTSTAHIVRALIEASGSKCGIIGTVGAFYDDVKIPTVNTTPESYELQKIFRTMLDNGCKYCVIEVSSTGLMMHRVDCIEFEIGVFTNLSPDHIGPKEHASFEEYMYWKSVLFERCKTAIVNFDDPAYENMLENCNSPVITYGLEKSDVSADNVKLLKNNEFIGISFDCIEDKENYYVEIPLPGYFNVHNALAAFAVCKALNINVNEIKECLKEIRVLGRAECVYVSDDYDVIIDFAHNGVSMQSMLDTLKSYPHNRIIALYGSVGGRTQLRRKELGLITGKECDLSIVTSDDPDFENPDDIIKEIGHYVEEAGGKYIGIVDREEAIMYALDNMQKGDILLLAGKGHEQFMKINGEKVPFSEKACIEKFIKRRAQKNV